MASNNVFHKPRSNVFACRIQWIIGATWHSEALGNKVSARLALVALQNAFWNTFSIKIEIYFFQISVRTPSFGPLNCESIKRAFLHVFLHVSYLTYAWVILLCRNLICVGSFSSSRRDCLRYHEQHAVYQQIRFISISLESLVLYVCCSSKMTEVFHCSTFVTRKHSNPSPMTATISFGKPIIWHKRLMASRTNDERSCLPAPQRRFLLILSDECWQWKIQNLDFCSQ